MSRSAASHLALVLGLLGVMLFAGACGASFVVPHKAMPAGASFTGLWYSNYEDMHLVQNGDKVTGTFEYKTGGQIAGTLEGGVLLFDWVQVGDLSIGRREVKGKGYLVMGDDGKSFAGEWGYNDARTGGGTWTADKALEDYSK